MTQLFTPMQPAGIYFGVLGNIEADWLAQQDRLTIVMKDGYKFFEANRDLFAARFADPAKQTIILINDPATPFIEAIADKDYHKTPDTQINDYMQTLIRLQEISKEARAKSQICNLVLAGFKDVPTENIFLGDTTLIKKFYPTESYRGPLEGCKVDATQSGEARALFDRAARTCDALLKGRTVIVKDPESGEDIEKILPPARDLLSFAVPEKYRLMDHRR